jgi:hypothetical protein
MFSRSPHEYLGIEYSTIEQSKTYCCSLCYRRFKSLARLKKHIKEWHAKK